MKDAPSPMLKKVASVPSRLYSKVWQEYWVISNVLHCRYCLTCNTQLCFSHAGSSLVCLLPPPWLYYLGAVLQILLWTPLCYSAVDTCLKKVTSFSTSFSVSIICWLFVDLFVIISKHEYSVSSVWLTEKQYQLLRIGNMYVCVDL